MSARVKFPARLLIDSEFYEQKIKSGTDSLLMKLMYINGRSSDHKRNHNQMCAKSFDKILSVKKGEERAKLEAVLKASFRPLYEPKEILEISDEIERNIKFAIELASESPFRTVILTTKEKKEIYLKNSHYKDVKPISIKADDEAVLLVNSYYRETILT
jgi:hypothetical protein